MLTKNNTTRGIISAAFVAGLLGSAVCTASAADPSARTEVVSLRGLDLNTQQDQAVLHHRLRVAASKVCADPGASPMPGNEVFDECLAETFKSAWTQVAPLIAAARSQALFAADAGGPHWHQKTTIVASSASR